MRTRQTVIVATDLTTIGARTTKGTIARILGRDDRLTNSNHKWWVIETMETPTRHWTVHEDDLVPAPRAWVWYQSVHPRADTFPEYAALAAHGKG